MNRFLLSFTLFLLLITLSNTKSQKSAISTSKIVLESTNSWPRDITVDHIAPPFHRENSRVKSLWHTHFVAPVVEENYKRNIQSKNLYPADFGADPTGKTDSSAAFQQVIAALISFAGNNKLATNNADVGGAKIDLDGGTYLLNAPISFPRGYGNFVISGGTLIASSTFPAGRCLLETGPGCSGHDTNCNQFVQFTNLHVVGSDRASSGICVNSGTQINVGPHILVTGFVNVGIVVNGGFEVQVRENWIGQYYWTDGKLSTGNSTGIAILGNDHYITNNIIYSANVGVEVTGAANIITGVHTWNKELKYGGIGILFSTSTAEYTQNRVVDSYLDSNSIVTYSPEHLVISDCFFLASANVVIAAYPGKTTINGLSITQNEFDAYGFTNDTIVLDERQAKFTSIQDLFIYDNMIGNGQLTSRASRASAKLTLSNSTQWTFDFSKRLLFPFITRAQYSVSWQGTQFAQHYVEIPTTGTTVTVHADKPMTGTVYIDVDQNNLSSDCSQTCS